MNPHGAIQEGRTGDLLGGVPGVAPGKVVVVGGGVAGTHAAEMAVGLGAEVLAIAGAVRLISPLGKGAGPELVNSTSSSTDTEAKSTITS